MDQIQKKRECMNAWNKLSDSELILLKTLFAVKYVDRKCIRKFEKC